jgi:class 3 adenylate cyclase/pimeloyl-ACP methyl ester carboxylesterase
MEPRIQYARTSDGVNIAYCVMGDGPSLVYTSNVWGDIHWYLHNEPTRRQVDRLVAAGWRIVRYDGRGMGSSERDVSDFSLLARLRDLEAVVESAAPDHFVLCGYAQGGPPAISYSVQHPERVSQLILVNTFARGSAYYERVPTMRALAEMRSMAEEQWEFFTLSVATASLGFSDVGRARKTAELFRSSTTPKTFLATVDASAKVDVRHLLPKVKTPTLVVLDRSGFVAEDLSALLASQIPGACFVATDDYPQELHAFARNEAILPAAPAAAPSGTAVILFADIANSTGLTERMGDSPFRAKARDLDSVLRSVIREHAGTAIEGKLLGDGVLAVFTSARQAIEAALACGRAGDEAALPIHLGLHAGDVTREKDPDGRDNVYGGAVNIASRISGLSAPGEVLVSDIVRGLARTSAGVQFEDRGDQALKGVGEPVRVWAVREGE